jgi:hypothetical protein
MKIKIMIPIIIVLLTTIVYANYVDINFWRDSQLTASSQGAGYVYTPQSSDFVEDGCGAGTMLHEEFRLCWQKTLNTTGMAWTGAKSYCESLTLAGRTWSLPTVNEMLTLVSDDCNNCYNDLNAMAFSGFSSVHWTNDLYVPNPASRAWSVVLDDGGVYDFYDLTDTLRVVCVSRY